jgi:hypothetical protein
VQTPFKPRDIRGVHEGNPVRLRGRESGTAHSIGLQDASIACR